MSTSMATSREHRNLRNAWRKSTRMARLSIPTLSPECDTYQSMPTDPPIKRFAERHKYMNIDSIATRDFGFVLNLRSAAARANGSSSSGLLGRTDILQSIVSESAKTSSQTQSSSLKRGSLSDHRDYPSKRARPGSPSRAHDRDRWDGPSHRRHGSPAWDRRERERDGPPSTSRRFKDEREEKGVQLPVVISEFIGALPAANTFDGECHASWICTNSVLTAAGFPGPVFRTDDLMQLFRTAVIPSISSARARSPPPAPRPGMWTTLCHVYVTDSGLRRWWKTSAGLRRTLQRLQQWAALVVVLN